jgi:teichuronic acid biosynthesis glycosyltransferase TuaC
MKSAEHNTNLLIVSSGYPTKDYPLHTFVKGQVDALSSKTKRIVVLAVIPSPPRFIKMVGGIQPEVQMKQGLNSYRYQNVEVYFVYYNHLPFDYFRYRRHKAVYSKILELLESIDFKPHFIHAHFSNPGGMLAKKLASQYHVNYGITIHESENWLHQEILDENPDLVASWRNAHFLVRVNQKDLKVLKEYNRNALSIPNGFDPQHFNYKPEKMSNAQRIILNVGFYQPKKGQSYLIDAVKLMVDKGVKDFKVCIVGGGKLEKELNLQIKELNLSTHIELLGMKSHQDVSILMKEAHVFCLSSLSEGNPTVMFEALACGLPVVSTDVGGVSEILNNEVGMICEQQNSDQLAESLIYALDREWDREAISHYGSQYTWDSVAEKILILIKS